MKKAFVQLHVAVLLAGFTAIFGKLIDLSEAWIVWWRLLITILCLWLLLVAGKEPWRVPGQGFLKMIGVGGIVALHWLFFYGSIKYSNVSIGVTCLSSIGFFTAVLEPVIRKRRIDVAEIVLGLMAIAGIYLIFDFYPEYTTGILFGLVSAMLACLFPIFNKTLLTEFSPRVVTIYEMTGGLVILSLVLPIYLRYFPASRFLPAGIDWLWLSVLAVVCTVFAFLLSLESLKHLSAFTTNLSYNFEPIYSILLAFIIFNENKFLGAGFYQGFVLILLAVSLQMWRVYAETKKNKARGRLSEDIPG